MNAPPRPVAVVTGGSRGIGRACVRLLAEEGFDLVIAYHENMEEARVAALEVEALGGLAATVAADLHEPGAAATIVDVASETFGRIDVLVNNAGITRDRRIARMSDVEWNEVISVDLTAAFACIRSALPLLSQSDRAAIINISSIVGMNGNVGQSNYAAAKGGLIALTRSLARELAPGGVTVNAVAPGFILTDATLSLSGETMEANIAATPLGRPGEAKEVAHAVAWLASSAARFVTGITVPVDGGLSL
jgi:3-oxoacyl-[acyl-carrier protein] reductase